MKLRNKLVIYFSLFVTLATLMSIYVIGNRLIDDRLNKAIDEAVLETKQVSSMIKSDETGKLNITQFNRRDEYYMLVSGNRDAYYRLKPYNGNFYIEVFLPHGPQMLRGRFNVTYLIEEEKMIYNSMLGLFIIILLASVLCSILFSSKLVNPIRKLVLASNQMIEGDYDYPLVYEGKDELGLLTRRFIEMRQNIKTYIDELNFTALKSKRLYGALTHEIKTPLTSIMGYSELLLTEQVDDDMSMKALKHINEESKKLSVLSEKLLMLSGHKIERRLTDLSSLIEESLLLCKSNYEKKFKYDISGVCESYVDPFLFQTLVTNLINNAIEAIDENGHISISLYEDKITFLDDGNVAFPENPFEAFSKGDKEGYHLGLGLALVKDIVEAHGDSIYIEGKSVIIEFTTSLHLTRNSEKKSSYDESKGGK